MIELVLAGAALALLSGKEGEDVKKLSDVLREALPPRLAQFADAFASAALVTTPASISPAKWGLFGAALVDRESFTRSGAWALRPGGPAGTGDPTPRWRSGPPSWADDLGLLTGRTKDTGAGVRLYEVRPPTAGGASVPGWGYGLGQHDWEDRHGDGNRSFIDAGDWKDPGRNVLRTMRKLRDNFDATGGELQDRMQRAADGYNADLERVLASGDPDALTTGGDYGSDVLARAAAFEEDLPA